MILWQFHCSTCDLPREEFCDHVDRGNQMCSECGGPLEHVQTVQAFSGDLPQTKTGIALNYYDDTLGEYITSRKQRERLMAKKGLRTYEPDPEMKKSRAEIAYTKKHSTPAEGKAAIRAIGKEAGGKRQKRIIKEKIREGLKGM